MAEQKSHMEVRQRMVQYANAAGDFPVKLYAMDGVFTMSQDIFRKFLAHDMVCRYMQHFFVDPQTLYLYMPLRVEHLCLINDLLRNMRVVEPLDSSYKNILMALGIGHRLLFEKNDTIQIPCLDALTEEGAPLKCYNGNVYNELGEQVTAAFVLKKPFGFTAKDGRCSFHKCAAVKAVYHDRVITKGGDVLRLSWFSEEKPLSI